MDAIVYDKAKSIIQAQNKSKRTEQAYMDWIYRFLVYHHKTLSSRLNKKHLLSFLTFLTHECKVAAATRNQALQAILFLYKQVLKIRLTGVSPLRLHKTKTLPPVLCRSDIHIILKQLKGDALLMTSLLYGCGLRLEECISLRVKNVDIEKKILIIKGEKKERVLTIPETIYVSICHKISILRLQYQGWLQDGFCGVSLPEGIQKINPEFSFDWHWQYIFPSERPLLDPASGKFVLHHRSNSFLEKAIKQATTKAQLSKNISCHVFRHSFATHLLEKGHSIKLVQKLLGHSDIRSTLIYKRMIQPDIPVRSPLDELIRK